MKEYQNLVNNDLGENCRWILKLFHFFNFQIYKSKFSLDFIINIYVCLILTFSGRCEAAWRYSLYPEASEVLFPVLESWRSLPREASDCWNRYNAGRIKIQVENFVRSNSE